MASPRRTVNLQKLGRVKSCQMLSCRVCLGCGNGVPGKPRQQCHITFGGLGTSIDVLNMFWCAGTGLNHGHTMGWMVGLRHLVGGSSMALRFISSGFNTSFTKGEFISMVSEMGYTTQIHLFPD